MRKLLIWLHGWRICKKFQCKIKLWLQEIFANIVCFLIFPVQMLAVDKNYLIDGSILDAAAINSLVIV